MTTAFRIRLPNRRLAETFAFEVGGLRYTATFSRFPDGRISELLLNNHKSNSTADIETIRKALCRDARGDPSGPLAAALDRIAEEGS